MKNVLNIISYQENTNQNHNETPLHTDQDGYKKKRLTMEAREIAKLLRALSALAKEPSLIPNIHLRQFTTTGNSS